MDRTEIIEKLKSKDDKAAYAFSRQIAAESAVSDRYYSMIPDFAGMLENDSSYIRTRAFMLICAQARWDREGSISAVFARMRVLLYDDKPTVVRQCLQALHEVVLYRPELAETIEEAVRSIDIGKYKDSMAPLIKKDADRLLLLLA